jgi:biopolymer transport protein ExbB/TolQ
MPDKREVKSFMQNYKAAEKEVRKELKKRFEKISVFITFFMIIIFGFMSYSAFQKKELLIAGLFLFITISNIIGFAKARMIKPRDLEEEMEKLEERVKNIEKLSTQDTQLKENEPSDTKLLEEKEDERIR